MVYLCLAFRVAQKQLVETLMSLKTLSPFTSRLLRASAALCLACITHASLARETPFFTPSKQEKPPTTAPSKISVVELNELTNGYADRYMTYIVNAVQKIENGNTNAEQRRFINQVQLVQVSSIYDIVTTSDPLTQLVDLVLVVTLQSRKWIDDNEAEKRFGERGQYLVDASRRTREDVWKIAARVLKPEQLEQLDYLITDWHKRNPNVTLVSYVRFDDFAASRGKSMLADVRSGGGFLSIVDDAKKSVDEVRLLAERAFYLGKRMPFMVNWHVKSAVSDAMAEPAIQQMQDTLPKITSSVDRITSVAEKIPENIAKERTAIFDFAQKQQPFISSTLSQVRGTVQDTDKLAGNAVKVTQSVDRLLQQVNETNAALNGTMKTMDQIFMAPGRNAPVDPKAKPFDIEQYTTSAMQMTNTLKEANTLLAGTAQLLQSPALNKPMEAAAEHSSRVMDAAFWRAIILITFFFVLLALYRTFTVKLLHPKAGA
jgi:hypothetical protein